AAGTPGSRDGRHRRREGGTRLCWRTLSSTSIGSARSRLRKQHRAKASIRKKHWSRSTRPRSTGTRRPLVTRGSNSATRPSPRRSAAALGFAWSIRGTLCTSLLDPFKGRITRLLDTHPYSAQQIFQRLREEGYGGGVTILRTYVRRIRPPKLPVYLKLHFAPGECAQVDWGFSARSQWATRAAGSPSSSSCSPTAD